MRSAFSGQLGRILLVGSCVCAMTVLDTNVVGIILPTIARRLAASFADIEWVVSAYVLCFAALLLPAGAIADRHGRRRVLLWGLALFALASGLCALAPTARALYLARALQGVGAAFLLAPALAVIGHAFHDDTQRARAWATWGGVMGLTMVLSPLAGGAINAWLGWRWAFAINLPACLMLAAAVRRLVPESRNPQARALDVPGILSFSSAVFLLTWALITGPEHGWGSVAFATRAGGGLLLFMLFLGWQARARHPMLALELFRTPAFAAAVVAMFAYAASAQVMASLFPLFLQNARGLAPIAAAVAMLPFALAMLLLPQLGRHLARSLSSSAILALGLSIVTLGNALMALAAASGNGLLTVLGMAVLGSGGGLLNGETQKAIMGNVTPARAGMASGISTTARFIGVLAGFSGWGAVLADGTRAAMTAHLGQAGTVAPAVLHAFMARAMAGDFAGAAQAWPADTALAIARRAYGNGFSHAFIGAALLALGATAVVCWARRYPAGARPAAAAPLQPPPAT